MQSLLERARRAIDDQKRTLKSLQELNRDPQVRADLVSINRACGKLSRSLQPYAYGTTYQIHVSIDNLNTFKTGPLPRLLERLMDVGVVFDQTYDWPASGNRDYKGRLGNLFVTVVATLSQEASKCSVRVVGEVTTTSPKYEIICA